MLRISSIALLLFLLHISVHANTIRVPTDQPTIQAGVNAAFGYDTVLVASGTYTENIKFTGISIVLMSEAGRDSTFIEPSSPDSHIVIFDQGEDNSCVIDGFTIRNTTNAQGVVCRESSPTIQNCDISFCTYPGLATYSDMAGYGGAIYCHSSSAVLIRNIIHDNAAGRGAGVFAEGNCDNLTITGCEFYENDAFRGPGICCFDCTNTVISNNRFWKQYGPDEQMSGAIYMERSTGVVTSNTLDSNSIGMYLRDSEGLYVANNVVTRCGTHPILQVSGTSAVIDYNCFWENQTYGTGPGPNGFVQDPLFMSPDLRDYSLSPESPCIDAGDPDPSYNDLDGSRCDIGAIPLASHECPIAYSMQYGPEFIKDEVRSEIPTIYWSYYDTAAAEQNQYELEIGTDLDWDIAEMWSTGAVASVSTEAEYDGLPFEDHEYYYLRIRVDGGLGWGEWKQYRFLARLTTVIPVPDSFSTIQAAIDFSEDGDSVLVAPGTYQENIDFSGKGIVIMSSDGPETTILLPQDSTVESVFFGASESDREFRGFTISGSAAYEAVTIARGIPANSSVLDCIFTENNCTNGVIGCRCDALISRNLFYSNMISPCVILMNGSPPTAYVINNTFSGNYRAVYNEYAILASATVKNNIIVGNETGLTGPFADCDYNDVWGNEVNYGDDASPGPHDISADPLFNDTLNLDYTLREGSPCIDAGDPDPDYNDPDGTRNDIGAYYLDLGSYDPYSLDIETESLTHVLDHTPTFTWRIPDTFVKQSAYELEVGTDNDWSVAEMWATGEVWSDEDSTLVYAGSSLEDGVTYHVRLRLRSEEDWADWDVLSFHMNSLPSIPIQLRPTYGDSIPATIVTTAVWNSTDAQMDSLAYDFEIWVLPDETEPPSCQYGIAEQPDSTLSDVFDDLSGGRIYRWRTRAFDGYEYSNWSPFDSFYTASVNVHLVPSAYSTIQDAVYAASSGDSVLIAPGTYTGTGNTNINFGGKDLVLVSEEGKDNTVIDCQGSASNYCRAFVFDNGETPASKIRGITVVNGYANYGGAIYCDGASPTVSSCLFVSNTGKAWGGALCFLNSSARLDSVVFTQNQGLLGGCLYMTNSALHLTDCEFDSNDGADGGGICCRQLAGTCSIGLERCHFTMNSAGNGGAIYVESRALISLRDCRLVGNTAGDGGAICIFGNSELRAENCSLDSNSAEVRGGAIYTWSDSPLILDSCSINWNHSDISAVIDADDIGQFQLSDCEIRYNQTDRPEYGAITILGGASPWFGNCSLENNQGNLMVFSSGGGPVLDSCIFINNVTYWGVLACIAGPSATITNCTFSNNYADEYGTITCSDAPAIMQNCLVTFSKNVPGIWSGSGTPQLTCCNIFGNEGGDWVGSIADQYGVDGNISLDPEYCDTAAGDFGLLPTSPCAPANNECAELIGARGVGCGYVCGDADASSGVDIDDVVYLINYIFLGGPAPDPYKSGDANCSGAIDIDDVVYLISYIFTGGNAPCDPNGDEVPDC